MVFEVLFLKTITLLHSVLSLHPLFLAKVLLSTINLVNNDLSDFFEDFGQEITAISDQTHHEKAISKAQSRDHNVGTNQEHFHQ